MRTFWPLSPQQERERAITAKLEAARSAMYSAVAATASMADSLTEHLKTIDSLPLNSGNDAVVLCDLDGRITRCQDKTALFAPNVINRPISEFLGADAVSFKQLWDSLVGNPPGSSVRMMAQTANGERRPVDVTLSRTGRQHPEVMLLIRNLVSGKSRTELLPAA